MAANYDTLILSGNSTNAVFTLGALQKLLDNKIIEKQHIHTFVGTSSGALVSLLLALDFEPIEILVQLCVNKSYSKIPGFNLMNLGSAGLLNFDPIERELENMIMTKFGYVPTLGAIRERYGKTCIFVTFNLTEGKKEYLSPETHSEVCATKAARMSSTFPFLFNPYEHEGKYYVDGGIVDNFAMAKAQSLGGKCLGVCNRIKIKPYTPTTTYLELFISLFLVFIGSAAENATILPGNRVLNLEADPNFFNFQCKNSELIDLFDNGNDNCQANL